MSFLFPMQSPALLRKQIRALRRALPAAERQQAARQLARRAAGLPIFADSRRIAGYLAVDGELDPGPLLSRARELGKQIYLPVLTDDPRTPLLFAPYRPDTALRPNRFGIPEPQVSAEQLLPSRSLDLVLTPLVVFDAWGNRLGMGGGYYDRTFAFRHPGDRPSGPFLLGLAYELQKVAQLAPQPWDIPLDGIVTERAFYPGPSRSA